MRITFIFCFHRIGPQTDLVYKLQCPWRNIVLFWVHFLNVFLLPLTKVLGQSYQLQKCFLHKSNERNVVSEYTILARKWSKIEVDLLVFTNHPTVHSGGVRRGRVTRARHMTPDTWKFFLFSFFFVERFSISLMRVIFSVFFLLMPLCWLGTLYIWPKSMDRHKIQVNSRDKRWY